MPPRIDLSMEVPNSIFSTLYSTIDTRYIVNVFFLLLVFAGTLNN
jgi:hypothetical protein